MAIKFHVKGTATDAFRSNSGKTPAIISGAALQAQGDASIFGGSVIDISTTKYISYPGFNNWTTNSGFSVLIRCLFGYAGSPPRTTFFYEIGGPALDLGGVTFAHLTNGKLSLVIKNNTSINSSHITAGTFVAPTVGVATDIMVVWTGSPGAGTVRIGINGVEEETFTGGAPITRDANLASHIAIGVGQSGDPDDIKLNEFIVWDSTENHVYTPRTDFFTDTAFEGNTYTDPGIANVSTGVDYTFAGLAKTGTLDTISNVTSELSLEGQDLRRLTLEQM